MTGHDTGGEKHSNDACSKAYPNGFVGLESVEYLTPRTMREQSKS